MRFASIFLLVVYSFATASCGVDVPNAKAKLVKLFQGNRIPDGMSDWLAVLDDSTGLLSCLPTIKDGRCYKSRRCQLPKLKFDGKMLPFVLKFCKHPWQIVIEFLPLDLPWWAKINLQPFVITFNNNEKNGVFTIKSHTTIKAKVKYVNFGIAKASLLIDGIIRYDCTKPKGSNNWLKRARYNLQAPNGHYTSSFYKLKIRMEFKTKRFNWFKFNYKCKRCEDLVKKSGVFGRGPASCHTDMIRYEKYMINARCRGRRLRCHQP